ncbi:hypothetical protein [Hankyongella ginsenosidimutans]|uniref:hypothetical protein n=1 Tax=Hankyongella ginsenosidimutans TaxID=1763828 RepID=UPI001FEB725E|nr:hypothetical protein [Hankyongella ginsenosidimutans]
MVGHELHAQPIGFGGGAKGFGPRKFGVGHSGLIAAKRHSDADQQGVAEGFARHRRIADPAALAPDAERSLRAHTRCIGKTAIPRVGQCGAIERGA